MGATLVWDNEQMVPYAFLGDQWVGFDDPRSFKVKVYKHFIYSFFFIDNNSEFCFLLKIYIHFRHNGLNKLA